MAISIYAKDQIARHMFDRGQSFLAAAIFLQTNNGNPYVATYLVCQSFELVLKSLLLFKDYDKFKSKLKSRYGHRIYKLSTKVQREYGCGRMSNELVEELKKLESLYGEDPMYLRYASFVDVIMRPEQIKRDELTWKLVAVIRLMRRHLRVKAG